MAKLNLSNKRVQIDKANATMVALVAISSFVTVFSLVAVRALWSQRGYQSRVINAKEAARDQLKKNVSASQDLVTSYKSFVSTTQNVLGGDPNGSGPKDGDNAKIILDALPSKYDFPALATSLDGLLTQSGLQISGLTGTDDELAQQQNVGSDKPQPIPIPINVSVSGSYTSIQNLISVFEHSIRPIQVQTITLDGSDADLTVNVTAQTYYQPSKTLKIETEVIQ